MGKGSDTGADKSVDGALPNPIAVGAAIPESSTGATDGRGPSGAVGKSDTTDRKSPRLNSSHSDRSRMPSSA